MASRRAIKLGLILHLLLLLGARARKIKHVRSVNLQLGDDGLGLEINNNNNPTPRPASYEEFEQDVVNVPGANNEDLDRLLEGAMTIIESVNVTTNSTAANVSWSYTGAHPFQFNIGLFLESGVLVREYVVTANRTGSILDLDSCANYTIGVKAFGSSSNVVYANFVTGYAPPIPSKNYEIAATGPDSVHVNWNPPIQAYQCLREYEIHLALHGHSDLESVASYSVRETEFEFKRLNACSKYDVRIFAVDTKSYVGELIRVETNYTEPKLPRAPELSAVASSVKKNSVWLALNALDATSNCSLTSVAAVCSFVSTQGSGYELRDANVTVDAPPPGATNLSQLEILVEGLSPYSRYVCLARTHNEAGASDWSEPVLVETLEDRTSKPENLNYWRDQNDLMSFIWSAPSYRPSLIVAYRVNLTWFSLEAGKSTPENKMASYMVSAPLKKFTIVDEIPNSHYVFEVEAISVFGSSEPARAEFNSVSKPIDPTTTASPVSAASRDFINDVAKRAKLAEMASAVLLNKFGIKS
ncbi:hypothetical protein TKK_0004319 [Trichogramma kaykai]|uniref:Fibronectin type-III domain-containing protein n=1 Tax=Trichogramma kaykai TaxID=54128 RepID=A0ABD2XMV2_9HYME